MQLELDTLEELILAMVLAALLIVLLEEALAEEAEHYLIQE